MRIKIRDPMVILCTLFLLLLTCMSLSIRVHANPIKQDRLSEQQEAEGWELIDGYAYPPGEAEGQAGMTAYPTDDFSAGSKDAVTVQFTADVPPEVTEPVIVYFTNAATYQEAYIILYSSNNYTKMVKMMPGSYYFTDGGPESDVLSVYNVTEPVNFIVRAKRSGQNIKPVIRSRGDIIDTIIDETVDDTLIDQLNNPIEPETQPQVEETQPTEQENILPENMPLWAGYVIFAVVCILIGVGLLGLIVLKGKADDGTLFPKKDNDKD